MVKSAYVLYFGMKYHRYKPLHYILFQLEIKLTFATYVGHKVGKYAPEGILPHMAFPPLIISDIKFRIER